MSEHLIVSPDYSDVSDIRRINTMQPFPLIPSYHKNLPAFLESISDEVKTEWEAHQTGEIAADELKKTLIFVVGWPGHGKSEIARFLQKRFSLWYSRFNPFCSKQYKEVGWEPDAEAPARAVGLITTPKGVPCYDQELIHAQGQIRSRLVGALNNNENDVIVCESPAGIAYWNDHQDMIGTRPLNAEVVREAVRHEPPFDQFNYRTKVIASVGGPLLRYLMVYFREDMNNAPDLETAQKLAYIYGYRRQGDGKKVASKKSGDPPLTLESWNSLKNGATIEEIETVEDRTELLFAAMRRRGMFPTDLITKYRDIVHQHDHVVRALMEVEESSKSSYIWELPWFLNFLMSNSNNFNVPEQDRILLYDDPTPIDLGINSEGRLAELVNHLKVRGKGKVA